MRRLIVGFVLGAVLALAIPALADHVNEPIRPLTGIGEIRVFDYPHLSTQVACDGSEVYPFDKARLEFDANFQKDWPNPGDPSEHWTATIEVRSPQGVEWFSRWNHQNSRPHTQKPRFEVTQSSTYNIQSKPGLWTVTVQLVGDVSGNQYVKSCTFLVE